MIKLIKLFFVAVWATIKIYVPCARRIGKARRDREFDEWVKTKHGQDVGHDMKTRMAEFNKLRKR